LAGTDNAELNERSAAFADLPLQTERPGLGRKSAITGAPHDAAHSFAKRVIVESIVKLGAALDIRVVGKGIETEAERAIMRMLGCLVGHGYLFAAPLDELGSRRLLNDGWFCVIHGVPGGC